jgi:hypothetical protein
MIITLLSVSQPWNITVDSTTGERLSKPITGCTVQWTDKSKNPNGLGLSIIKSTVPPTWFSKLQNTDLSRGGSLDVDATFTFNPQGKVKLLAIPDLGVA